MTRKRLHEQQTEMVFLAEAMMSSPNRIALVPVFAINLCVYFSVFAINLCVYFSVFAINLCMYFSVFDINLCMYFSYLSACNRYSDCESCVSAKINFECRWCGIINKCSDSVDWFRQEWINAGCTKYVSVANSV